MTQNYKPAYPAEFRQQMVELVALGKCPKEFSKEFGCHSSLVIGALNMALITRKPGKVINHSH